MRIGPHLLPNRLLVAPMAGVTDRPFRRLCRALGAGYAVSEMVSALPQLRHHAKTLRRMDHAGEPAPIAVQIVGTDPPTMADAARHNMDLGAQIIDINMGCPAKKVCDKWAGSALMQDEAQALRIVEAVVAACEPRGVPVTLKMRTGWSAQARNAPRLARAAEEAGVQMLVIHGRTREQGYRGCAEHQTVAEIKQAVRVPVVANGDITSPETAREVLARTGVDAVMVGRAAQGRPWLFREMAHFLATGQRLPPPSRAELRACMREHLHEHHALYGEGGGARSVRKHLLWYLKAMDGVPEALAQDYAAQVQAAETLAQHDAALTTLFERWEEHAARTPSAAGPLAHPAHPIRTAEAP